MSLKPPRVLKPEENEFTPEEAFPMKPQPEPKKTLIGRAWAFALKAEATLAGKPLSVASSAVLSVYVVLDTYVLGTPLGRTICYATLAAVFGPKVAQIGAGPLNDFLEAVSKADAVR
jgi:hypothetical protein